MSLGKFNSGDGFNFNRYKKEILNDYASLLSERKIISDNEKNFYLNSEEGRTELLDVLFDHLYQVETVRGRTVNTLDSFYIFCTVVLKEYEGHTVWNDFVKDMFLSVEHNKNTCIMASRSLGKSFFLYCLYPAYKMFLYDRTKFLNVSNIPTQCVENLRHLKNLVNLNEMLFDKKEVHLGKDLKWTERQIQYNGGMFITLSAGTSPRGLHVHYTIVDDMITEGCQLNDDEAINYVFGQLYPTAQRNKGRMIVSGTPLHRKDLYHYLMGEKKDFEADIITDGGLSWTGFYSKTFPISDDRVTSNYPEIFSDQEVFGVGGIKDIQGEIKFQREYLLNCIDESMNIFSEHLLASVSDDSLKYLYSAPDDTESSFLIAADVATSGHVSADNSAFVVLELKPTESGLKKVVCHIVSVKGMEVSDQVDALVDLSRRFRNARVVVEKNNVGVSLIQDLAKRNIYVEDFVTTRNSKIDMIRYLEVEFKNRNLWFPEEKREITALKRELMNFGVKTNKAGVERLEALTGKDDMVMALAIANRACQSVGGLPNAVLLKRK